jgi:hypothetical protein
MNEKNYSKREIDFIIKEIHNDVKSILTQTTKTNGRVSKLENWRSLITGGLIVVGAFLTYIFSQLPK